MAATAIQYEPDSKFYLAQDDKDAVLALVSLEKLNQPFNTARRGLSARYAALVEGMALSSLAAHGYQAGTSFYFKDNNLDIPLVRNWATSIVDTTVSWIAALDNPKPTFITSEGNWADKRKAEKLRKLVEAGYKDKQGRFQDTYQMGQHAFRLAIGATGAAAVKVCVYPNETKVVHELHDTLTMFVDYGEQSYGELLTLGEVTWMDPERLIAMYPDFEDEIRANAKPPPREADLVASESRIRKLCPIYEGWRVSTGDTVGRYVCGLEDGTCFANEEYDYPSPPFAFLVPCPHLWGPWGHTMVHFIYESVRRDNMIISSIDKSVMKSNKQVTFANMNALVDKTALDRVEDNQIVEVSDMAQAPRMEQPAGFSPAHLNLAEQHRQDAFQISGMSEARAGSKAEPGIDSAIGQRNVAAFVNKRFAGSQTKYVRFMAVDIAELDIRAMREVYKREKNFSRRWSDGKFLKTIDGDVLDLANDRFELSAEATSGIKNTPADRTQTAWELYQSGVISGETYAAATQDYDTPEAIQENSVQVEWLEGQMYEWCYATDEEVEDPEFYKGPIKFMDLNLALIKVIDGLMQAQIDELENERLEFFMLFLGDIDAQMKAKATFTQSLQQPPAAPGAQPAMTGDPAALKLSA